MSNEPMRNHFSIVFQNLLMFLFIFLVMSSWLISDIYLIIGAACVLLAVTIFLIMYWKRTTITFCDTEVVVKFDLVYKGKKNIPHEKIASVMINRTVLNRIFGTSTLVISINSSSNVSEPGARFVFVEDLAERIRGELSAKMYDSKRSCSASSSDGSESEDVGMPSMVIGYGAGEVLKHTILGKSSVQYVVSIALIAYAIISILWFSGGGVVWAILLLVIYEVLPVITASIQYFNFEIKRVGGKIYIKNGMVELRHTEFEIGRINAITIKRPFIARMLGMAYIEVEVIGIRMANKEQRPLLCLLSKWDKVMSVLEGMLPEYSIECDMMKQPKSARKPLLVKAALLSLITALVLSYPIFYLYSNSFMIMNDMGWVGIGEGIFDPEYAIQFITPALLITLVAYFFFAAHRKQRICEIGFGKDMMEVINGVMDIDRTVMRYDRIQIVNYSASPIPRRLGLARCNLSMMTSNGFGGFKSGFFYESDLHSIGDIMLERLNGDYDYDSKSI